jgi:hypothetical protein
MYFSFKRFNWIDLNDLICIFLYIKLLLLNAPSQKNIENKDSTISFIAPNFKFGIYTFKVMLT